jgi:RHS repeat-associated protein
MGGMRLSRTRAMVHTGTRVAWTRATRSVGLLALLLVAGLSLGAAGASAEPLCTNKWTGGSSGSWQTASNWSTGKVPTSAEVACIGAGVTVEVSGGTNAAGVLADEGTLVLRGGSLELANALEESTVHALTASGGTLKGAAKLGVSSSLSWTEGKMEGSGSTVLKTAASGMVRAISVTLSERRLVNEGTLTLTAGSIEFEHGAVFSNGGTFDMNDNEKACEEGCNRTGLERSSGSSSFVNTGVVKKVEGARGVGLDVNTENLGTINGKSGPIVFAGSSNASVLGNGSVLEGVIEIENASVTGDDFKVTGGELTVESGTLSMAEGDTATVGVLAMTGGTLTGPGTLKVTEMLSWSAPGTESTMSGSGLTVLASGAIGSISVPSVDNANLAKRSFINEGTLTLVSGHISLSEEAKLENKGTFKVNSESTNAIVLAPGGSGKVVNSGMVEKSSGTGTSQVSVLFESSGTVEGQKGQLAFTAGGSSTSAGKWVGGEGASVALSGGSFTFTESSWSGAIDLTGASVTAEGLRDSTGKVSLQAGTLSVAGSSASTINDLSLTDATLNGAGMLKVTGLLEWTGEGGVMSGSGSTVLEAGASGKIEVITPAEVKARSLVNHGTLTWGSGALILAEGAQLSNSSTFYANDNGTSSSCGGLCRGEGIDPGTGSGTFENTGSVIEIAGSEAEIEVPFNNQGSVTAETGKIRLTGGGISGHTASGSWSATGSSTSIEFAGGTFTLGSAISVSGELIFSSGEVKAGDLQGPNAEAEIKASTLTLNGPTTSVLKSLGVLHPGGILTGSGSVEVSHSLVWSEGSMKGAGVTVLESGATSTLESSTLHLERELVNEGTLTWASGEIELKGGTIENSGTFISHDELGCEECSTGMFSGGSRGSGSFFRNTGMLRRTGGRFIHTDIGVIFENDGVIEEPVGYFEFPYAVYPESETLFGGEENPQEPAQCGEEESVSCQSGNYSQTQTDFSIGGRGVGLILGRTYNSQAAVAGTKGIFGYGWSSSFSDHLVVEKASKHATLVQADGSAITFTEGAGEAFTAPAWTQDVLSGSSSAGYTLTLESQTVYKFNGSTGRLESVTDRNGNATTLAYNGSGNLETITDPAGRKIKLAYNSEGLVESAEDPMKHVVKYMYESGNLKSVTQPGESTLRWQFKYDGSHRMTELVDGRSGKTTIEYNSSNQVVSEIDPMKRTTSFEYTAFHTTMTNHATGGVTVQYFTSNGMGTSVTKGYGTSSATTETRRFNVANKLLSVTDGNGHTTQYGYDTHGNRTSMINPDKDETKWTYDTTHDIETETLPSGETTTYKRNSDGDPEVIERPAPGSTVQSTSYKYTSHGQIESMTDPLKRTWKYEYDTAGDKIAEIDPEGDKRTWGYNEDSQETSVVSPRGHVSGAKESEFMTTTERDAQGRSIKVTDPLGHETKYTYDGDGNVETVTDPEGHKTTYTYDADNERTKVEEPNKTITETEYNGAGQVKKQIDGNKHATEYVRNILEQVTEVIDPLGRKTLKEYDKAGNLVSITNAAKQTTTYKYDPANRLTEVSYSDGKTPTVKYEYNGDGDRTKMVDGTGTTTYEYDQLDRLTATKDGHGNTAGYEYDLANEQTKITYPNGKTIEREYDKAGRLKSTTDWSKNIIKYTYDADSDLTITTFPSSTSDEDTYKYDDTDAMTEVKMKKGGETLASLAYTRNKDGLVEKATSKGLPGEEKPTYTYDKNDRLTNGVGISYEYDAANNPTTIGTEHTYSYNAADELEKSVLKKATAATYTFNEVGDRTKTEPASGPATTYGYDQAGDLISVTRPKGTEVAAIEDTYGYDGDGLRTSETIFGTTTYLAWDLAEELPLILNDGVNSYIYGPGGLPVAQINSKNEPLYLHHDQQGSIRLITGGTGAVGGKCTYGAYGTPTCEGTATSPLGYDGQYTNSDSGLIYLRAREYDPATGQFISVDPKVTTTIEPYGYAKDNPVNESDPTGECAIASAAASGASKSNCNKWWSEAKRKYNFLLEKKEDLEKEGPASSKATVEGHVKAWNQQKKNLVKILKKFQAGKCEEEFKFYIPARVYELAEKEERLVYYPNAG